MIDLKAAAELLDFAKRMGDERRGREQLEGAVAVHNILEKERVAYLADEVGMGKTYVALGALALFRHFDPSFRVLVIAPRENIQRKWMKEQENFVRHNVRFADMRVKGLGDRLARSQVFCPNLATLAREAVANPNRDFFARMTSFSLPLGDVEANDVSQGWVKLKTQIRSALPWMDASIFKASGRGLKDNIARALCCALPVFDLVILDEAHNLKYGFKDDSSARNRVLSIALGHERGAADGKIFRGFGARARRVLFLSATPVDGSWRHLWNQLDVVGQGERFRDLDMEPETDEDHARLRDVARRFLVRRVTSMKVGDNELTKNLYRREWRRGGLKRLDEPISITDDRQRLVLALVQKKVSEILHTDRFQASWQIGMLASFESFSVTAKVTSSDGVTSAFDDAEQTKDQGEREGVDVHALNALARDHRKVFGTELPHPKMDAVVDALSTSWRDGRKSLVFVRRVASVKELKRKLDDRYDEWLLGRLRREMPLEVQTRLESLIQRYSAEKKQARDNNEDGVDAGERGRKEADRGGTDTFFAWFFRGEGPERVLSGAALQKRFLSRNSAFATFFDENHVATLLGATPGTVTSALALACGMSDTELRSTMRVRMARFLGRAKRVPRGERFEAAQAAGVEFLKERDGPWRDRARALWHRVYGARVKVARTGEAPELGDALETRTVFTELERHPELRAALWPISKGASADDVVLEEARRAQLLGSAARLGHAFLDLYTLVIARLKSLEARAQDDDEEGAAHGGALLDEYVAMLERQRAMPVGAREWGAYDELAAIASSFELLVDVNLHELRGQELAETARALGALLGSQQPVGGMWGQVNQRLVRQFRMPGYPFVLVTTDLLQEGEDLHTFCSDVHHYGIAWTPSSMEQRIGRIDRVRSQTDRRIAMLAADLQDDDKLHVYFPHLQDTVEKLQVDRVLRRMDEFLRLMHEGLAPPRFDERKLDLRRELFAEPPPAQLAKPLRTAFPVDKKLLVGDQRSLAVQPQAAASAATRFSRLRQALGVDGVRIDWEEASPPGSLLGTAWIENRQQPFVLALRSVGDRLVVRCVSPVGEVGVGADAAKIETLASSSAARIGAIPVGDEHRSYDLTVEDDVILAEPGSDADRVGQMLARVVRVADELEKAELAIDQPLADFRPHIEQEVIPDDV